MKKQEFERFVARVLDELPDDFAEKLLNVEVVVESRPSREELEQTGVAQGMTLLGLYQGVPLPGRGMGYTLVLPDKITIFKEPIENDARQVGVSVTEVIRKVVLHEVAHHFGIPDGRLRELGY